MRFVRFASVPFFPRYSSFVRRLVAVRYLAMALLVLAAAAPGFSQSDRGTVAGTILDSSGGAVQGATVTATNANTGAVYKTTSTDTGAYRIPDMQVGVYNVSVAATGFKTSEQKGVEVQINTTAALDITLQPGAITETLTVNADVPTLQTETSDIGTVVSERQIIDLPLAVNATGQSHLRSPETFVFLTPGTAGPGTADSSNGIFQAKLAGGQNFGNEVLLDGASTARSDSGSSFDQTAPSVEALQEFKVTTSTIPSEFGRTTGGVESFTTKSGTNNFHGSLYDIFRNEDLNAKEWFQNLNNQPKSVDKKNDYGGSVGGPVWIPKLYDGRNKSFFFFSWEQYRQKQGSTNLSTVPTDAERQGDFSAFLGPGLTDSQNNPITNPCDNNNQILQGQIFDPSTTQTINGVQCRKPFAGNKVPISTVASNILAFIPEPTTSNKNQLINNFNFTSVNPILDTTWTVRVDHSFSDRDKLFFSFSKRDQESINGTPDFPAPIDGGAFSHPFITDYYRVGWDHFLSPSLLNHLNIGLNRIYNNNLASSANGTDWPAKLGISGAHGPIFPEISFAGGGLQSITGYGTAQFDANYVNSLVLADSVSWTRGPHTLRMGIDLRAYQYSVIDRSHESPGLGFDFAQTAVEPNLSGGTTTGNAFASFLIGAVQSWSLAVRSHQPRFKSHYAAGYVQDDFKARRNLMLNIGLRYEVETPRSESSDQQSVISLTAPNPGAIGPSGPLSGALIFGGIGTGRCNCTAAGAQTYYKNFAPRFGFSYAPDNLFGHLGKTVLRGGYAIYYGPLDYGDFAQSLTDGFTASPSKSAAFAPVIALDSGIPGFPPPPNLNPAQDNTGFGGGFGGPTYLAPGYGRPAMVQNWSLEAERQLAPDLILSIGYVGMHSTRLRSNLAQIDNLNPKFFSLGNQLNLLVTDPTSPVAPPYANFVSDYGGGATVAQALRPFPQYSNIDSDCCLENLGQSTYEAMLVKVERRFHSGLNLLASYTYSKTLTDADSALPSFAQFSGGGLSQNSFDLKSEKSLSYQDIPHTLVVSYIYELPVGKGKKFLNKGGVVDKVLGGWQVGGVQRYQSGQPLSFSCATGIPGYSSFLTGCIRFDRVPGQSLLSPGASSFDQAAASNSGTSGCSETANGTFTAPAGPSYFNCGAFIDPNATNLVTQRGYAFGNFTRVTGEVRSQKYFNEDFSIIKRWGITESQNLTLKGELVNAFNRHVFGRPDTGPGDSTFGAVFGTVDGSRKVQLALRYQF
jgi:Carboxypeptidase regulatory-like domain